MFHWLLSFVSLVFYKLFTVSCLYVVLWFVGWLWFNGLGAFGLV
jgi:hypothetical protein